MVSYKQFVTKSIKMTILYWPGDFNARVGAQPADKCTGSEGERTVNNNGRDLIDFCLFNKLKMAYTFFRHNNIHKFTREAWGTKSIIDNIIINEKLKNCNKRY